VVVSQARGLEIQFGRGRFPFGGVFVEFPPTADPVNLLGRRDFFQRYIIQFWDAAELMNIDTSPDYPAAVTLVDKPKHIWPLSVWVWLVYVRSVHLHVGQIPSECSWLSTRNTACGRSPVTAWRRRGHAWCDSRLESLEPEWLIFDDAHSALECVPAVPWPGAVMLQAADHDPGRDA
jgi:hypothetical protein